MCTRNRFSILGIISTLRFVKKGAKEKICLTGRWKKKKKSSCLPALLHEFTWKDLNVIFEETRWQDAQQRQFDREWTEHLLLRLCGRREARKRRRRRRRRAEVRVCCISAHLHFWVRHIKVSYTNSRMSHHTSAGTHTHTHTHTHVNQMAKHTRADFWAFFFFLL